MKVENGSYKGDCCSLCRHHKPLARHPSNKEPFRGAINDEFGYVCFAPEFDVAVFFDRKHGICEMFEPKLNDPMGVRNES